MNNYEKWLSCVFSLQTGFFRSDGHVLKKAGYVDSFCCEHPIISTSSKDTIQIAGGPKVVARLHDTGKPDDPGVLESLGVCQNCSFYCKASIKDVTF